MIHQVVFNLIYIYTHTHIMYGMDGNLQRGQLSHVAEGVRDQCADAVVAQVPV